MNRFLAITLLGEDRPGLIGQLAATIDDCGCAFGDSRAGVLGREFMLQLLVSGKWNAIAKLESALPPLAERLGLQLLTRRTEPRTIEEARLPYLVEIVALEKAGIVQYFADFFAGKNINIEEMSTQAYPAPHTGSPMYTLGMTVGIPASLSIADLRDAFLDLCDQLNLDGVIEPAKG